MERIDDQSVRTLQTIMLTCAAAALVALTAARIALYSQSGDLRADYYDSEGHVIRYLVQVPEKNKATFVSDIVPSAPRFRLSYELMPTGTLMGRFEIAPPGKPESFGPYLSWSVRRP